MSELNFRCYKCRVIVNSAPDPPEQAVREDCCEDHEYVYFAELRGRACKYCGKLMDYYGYDE